MASNLDLTCLCLPRWFGMAGAILLALAAVTDSRAERAGPSSRRTHWVLSEIMYQPAPRTDGRNLEFVEIHNSGLIPEDLGGHQLVGQIDFTFPRGTVVPAGGFLVVAAVPRDIEAVYAITGVLGGFNDRLSNDGGRLRLFNPAGAVLLDVEYRPTAPWPSGAAGQGPSLALVRPSYGEGDPRAWSASAAPGGSPGAWEPDTPPFPAPTALATVEPGEVILSEILFHPLSEDSDDEFVELLNRGTLPVDLSGWRFTQGISYEFPSGSTLAPGQYLVVARNVVRLRSRYGHLSTANSLGNFSGNLSNAGERLALARPETVVSTNGAQLQTNRVLRVVAELDFAEASPWSRWADGGGSSLELVDPRADPRFAANWTDSDETAKSAWTTIQATGVLDHGTGGIDQLQVLAQGAGAFLVDDVEVRGSTGANRIANGAFGSGISGWSRNGTLDLSRWQSDLGATAPGCLRVEAVARGDTGANRIATAVTSGLSPGNTVTLRARARWLYGHPEALLRLRGNWFEAWGALPFPANPGTPGAPNSRALPNAGPALADLRQLPILPAANQPVTVSIRIADPDGVASAVLRYRVDPETATTDVPMRDDGTGDDEQAGDGRFTAQLPGQASGRLVAFQIVANDGAAAPVPSVYPPTYEALARFGEARPAGRLGTYRLWMTQATFNRWTSRPKLDNKPLPITFVCDDARIVHGVGALYAGSPHISPGYSTPSGGLCGYSLIFPKDEPFLGATDVVLDWPGRDTTAQQEPVAYWIARELGIPFNHRRYVRLHVNGVTETSRGSIYEDSQQVNSDLIESWSPESPGGDLYKIEQWFEFNDAFGTTQVGPPRLEPYLTTGGVPKLARYRWNWLQRAVDDSANDYSSLFELLDVTRISDPDRYVEQLESLVDLDEWMRVFATENIVVNLDAWGYDIGKNMYAWKPRDDRWQLHMWDIDWVMLASAQHGYNPRSPLMYDGPAVFGDGHRDPAVARMYRTPAIRRAYWRAIHDAVHGPLRSEIVGPRLDAIHAALVAQGVTRSSGGALAGPAAVKTWLQQRRGFLLEQLATVAAPLAFDASTPGITTNHLVTLTGTAPVQLRYLRVGGVLQVPTWTEVHRWSLTLPLSPGTNVLTLDGLDFRGQPVAGLAATAVIVRDPETAPTPPRLLALHRPSAGVLRLEWSTPPGAVYQVQAAPNLPAAQWFAVGSELAANTGTLTFDLPLDPADPRRFFRLLRVR